MKNNAKIICLFVVLLFVLVLPIDVFAAMKSSSYVIYDSVMHSFDGPVISGVAHSISGTTATITWNTDVAADSFVIYDTDNSFAASREQGTSNKNYISHSVALTGLSANTEYYYRVRSERVNGGITIDNTTYNFTTGSEPAGEDEEPATPSGGGGILIIDKTDKIAPVISDISVAVVSPSSVEISWTTDEEATSFVEYGESNIYGRTFGKWELELEHAVILDNLDSDTLYHFRALSSDDWANVGYSEDRMFTTQKGEVPPEQEVEAKEDLEQSILSRVSQEIFNFFQRLFPAVSLNEIGLDPFTDIKSLDDFSNFVPAPILSGTPGVSFTATEATITWTTDIESGSQAAISSESEYDPNSVNPYKQIEGDAEALSTEHEVRVYRLSPDTVYHFQLRSKSPFGPTSRSRDFVFKTNIEELVISSLFTQIIDNETAVFKWVTNKEADSSVKYAPYRENVLAIDMSKTIKDNAQVIIHEIKLTDLEAGTFYEVEISSTDALGNKVIETLSRFSTAEDDLPPSVSNIKADSTIFVDRGNKIQTIVSWITSEPSTSRVYYQEGVHGAGIELIESTILNTNYTKEHVMVITKFKPGIVYTFRVESIDSGGNVVLSDPHTFMTAKKKESIIQVIIRILEETFGWLKQLT